MEIVLPCTLREWLLDEANAKALLCFRQPLTGFQLGQKMEMTTARASHTLMRFSLLGLVRCLNPYARASRVFWPTWFGKACQQRVAEHHRLPCLTYDFPKVNWRHYGDVCYSQRSAVIKALTTPMQAMQIARVASHHDPGLTMSANNTRDVLNALEELEIVFVHSNAHRYPVFDLTEQGRHMRRLLVQAEVRA